MFWKTLYNVIAIPVLTVGFHVAALFNAKVREGITGRRGVFDSLENQLKSARALDSTAWFHFTSVGEFEQAKPLIESIKDEARIVLTYYSPSVHPNVSKYPHRDAAVYLPADTVRHAQRLIALINPSILIFSKFDIWPNLVWMAANSRIPIILIAGTLHPKSRRLLPVARSFFKAVHRHIAWHCVISDADAARFRRICPPDAQIVVAGDTRFDRVFQHAARVPDNTELFPGQSTLRRPILVAGSTYAEEEAVLLESLHALRRSSVSCLPHLVLVPHEPTTERIAYIRSQVDGWGLSQICFSDLGMEVDLGETDVLVVDTVGFLAKLYRLGDVAFVGGSFHGSVHNVMEPAAMAKPIIFGPTIHNAYEAQVLRDRGAAKLIHDAQELSDTLKKWLPDRNLRRRKGEIGKQVIEENLGAAERTLIHLTPYLRRPSTSHRLFSTSR